MNQMKLTETDIKRYNEGQSKIKVSHQNKHGISIDGKLTYTSPLVFLFDYGLLDLFLKPDSPWQGEFWEWMFDKGYGHIDYGYPVILAEFRGESAEVKPTPQMLVGYVLEFLSTDRGK